jgi:hypothetical protein
MQIGKYPASNRCRCDTPRDGPLLNLRSDLLSLAHLQLDLRADTGDNQQRPE